MTMGGWNIEAGAGSKSRTVEKSGEIRDGSRFRLENTMTTQSFMDEGEIGGGN